MTGTNKQVPNSNNVENIVIKTLLQLEKHKRMFHIHG